jgi:WD40 repeat protein
MRRHSSLRDARRVSCHVQITSVDVERTTGRGVAFATAGLDKQVKLWRYDEGDVLAVGRGHPGAVTKVAIGPGNTLVASGGDDGSIMLWDFPAAVAAAAAGNGGANGTYSTETA